MSAIVEYPKAMPGTNAAKERIFSTINVLLTEEEIGVLVETVTPAIVVKTRI